MDIGQVILGQPVRVRGTITYSDTGRKYFMQDAAAAIFVRQRQAARRLEPGQRVEVEGVTSEGLYAPYIEARSVRVLDLKPLPPARRLSFDELAASVNHCRWVEIRGAIRSIERDQYGVSYLHLGVQGGRLRACTRTLPDGFEQLVGARVRVRGALGGDFNRQRQLIAPVLFFNGAGDLTVEEAAPQDPFSISVRPARSLSQFIPEGIPSTRVKIRGVVTHQQPGRFVVVRDGTDGLLVETRQALRVEVGDVIEAVGFPAMGSHSPYLQDAVFRRVNSGPPPSPVDISPADIIAGIHNADLVTIRSVLLNDLHRGGDRILILQADDLTFTASCAPANSQSLWPVAVKGSILRLTGIWMSKQPEEQRSVPAANGMLLRSSADLVVLHRPSWWTAQRLIGLIGILLAAILCGVVWLRLLHIRVRQQTEVIRKKVENQAVLEERQRLAREFHDTLQQELVAIVLQLDTAAMKFESAPAVAGRCLELARQIIRRSLTEFRFALWNMRLPRLDGSGLEAGLSAIVAKEAEGRSIPVELRITGTTRRLSGTVEAHLLRIGQEAISNAVRHARPKSVRVELEYNPERVRLRVTDDGCGFDPYAPVATGHFGLLGMRERGEKIGGVLQVRSHRGVGTEVEVETGDGHRGGGHSAERVDGAA